MSSHRVATTCSASLSVTPALCNIVIPNGNPAGASQGGEKAQPSARWTGQEILPKRRSVLIEIRTDTLVFCFARFLDANRYPLRSKTLYGAANLRSTRNDRPHANPFEMPCAGRCVSGLCLCRNLGQPDCAGGRLPLASDPSDRAVCRRRRRRFNCARSCQAGWQRYRTDHRGRESRRRRIDRRHRVREQSRTGRLHTAARTIRADFDQPGRLQEPALRPGEGFCADLA